MARNLLDGPPVLAAWSKMSVLDGAAEPDFDRLTKVAAQALGVSVCLVSLLDDRRQFFKTVFGLNGSAARGGGTRVTVVHDAGAAGPNLFGNNVARYERSWDLVLAALAALDGRT